MTIDRIIVLALTILALGLFTSQFYGKQGTIWHGIKGVLSLLLVIAVIGINTTNMEVVWDEWWFFHLVIGGLYLLCHGATCVVGILRYREKPAAVRAFESRYHETHKVLAAWSAMLLVITVVSIVVLRIVRMT